jgi:hypothetical protein
MGSISLGLTTIANGWQNDGTNQFCKMKITSIKQANSAGNSKQAMTQTPTEPNFNNHAASDSCPQSYIDTETNEDNAFREYISKRLPQYKASPILLAKIRNTINQERIRTNNIEK